jgi:hypothetical protein
MVVVLLEPAEAVSMNWVFVAVLGSAWRRVEEKRGQMGETELVVLVSLVSGCLLVGKAVTREGRMVERLAEGLVIRREE